MEKLWRNDDDFVRKGLSDQLRLPRLGKIRLGVRAFTSMMRTRYQISKDQKKSLKAAMTKVLQRIGLQRCLLSSRLYQSLCFVL